MKLERTISQLESNAQRSCDRLLGILAQHKKGLGRPRNLAFVAGAGLTTTFAIWGFRPVMTLLSVQLIRFFAPLPMLWFRQALTSAGQR